MSSVPLTEALPWSPKCNRKVLVCDSVETDGRFLLHTLCTQVLAGNGRVLWLTGGPVTETQVATGLKKIGCDAATGYLRNGASPSLSIKSLAVEIATQTLAADQDQAWNAEAYLKKIYLDIKTWVQQAQDHSKGPSWVILDDVSALASLLGERLVYCFVDSLSALASRLGEHSFGLMIRCSHDVDQEFLKEQALNDKNTNPGWVGAGGQSRDLRREEWVPWERHLVELADGIVDVVPLTSGYSREAHGRLVFSERPGARGWSDGNISSSAQVASTPWNKLVINYCIQDNAVRAIRLRGIVS
jgi:hypothetical protein